MDSHNIMFVVLAVLMVFSAFATVLTKSIIRAATYLFFVLLGTAGMYFLMGYTFLGAVQVMVYAGGIVVLYVFAILLTKGAKDKLRDNTKQKIFASTLLSLVGFGVFIYAFIKAGFIKDKLAAPDESVISMKEIGMNLLSTGANGYLLPFEVVSLLLLACIVAALLIARKR